SRARRLELAARSRMRPPLRLARARPRESQRLNWLRAGFCVAHCATKAATGSTSSAGMERRRTRNANYERAIPIPDISWAIQCPDIHFLTLPSGLIRIVAVPDGAVHPSYAGKLRR